MLKPIIISYKLTTCQLLYLTNTYKPREILLTIVIRLQEHSNCVPSSYTHFFSMLKTYLASLNSPARQIPGQLILSSISITVQACAKDLDKKNELVTLTLSRLVILTVGNCSL